MGEWLLDALEGGDPERTYVRAACFGLVTEVFQGPSQTLDFAGCISSASPSGRW